MNNSSLLRLQVRVRQAFADLRDDERGQAMIEYAGIALIVAMLVAVAGGALTSQGRQIGNIIAAKIIEAISKLHVGG